MSGRSSKSEARSPAVRDAILHGESEGKTFYDIMESGRAFGMITFDRHLIGLFERSYITRDAALGFATEKGAVGRGKDALMSASGGVHHGHSG